MFAVRRAIARSISSTAFRTAPQIARSRVTPSPKFTSSRHFSQISARFAEDPVKQEPSSEELKDVKEKSVLEPELAQSSEQTSQYSAQEEAATSESTDQVSAGRVAARSAPSDSTRQQFAATSESTDRARPNTHAIYVGNLLFQADESHLEQHFSQFGNISQVKIPKDDRGSSKGYGFVEFHDEEAARRAVQELDETMFHGRRLAIRLANRQRQQRQGAPQGREQRNPPSKTLFIGNMSYQMSDRDLNDLFRDIEGVVDVRVAVDRRSGQPRGFAHADFQDISSAQAAAELLSDKVIYGRSLKIDYSTSPSDRSANSAGQY